MNAKAIYFNPCGYGAKNLEDLMRFLTRSVNGATLATDEELYAAQVIEELLRKNAEKNKKSTISSDIQQELEHLRAKITLLETENTALKLEKEQDEQRIKYCVENTVIYSDGYLFVDLEQEEVVEGNLRNAIDQLQINS